MPSRTLLQALALAVAGLSPTQALVSPDGTGRLPALGWNSWNQFGCNIQESTFEQVAQAMVDTGLKDAGYQYVNIDDCWSNKTARRDTTTQEILPDFTKFPDGISGIAAKVHSLGLKFGIYSDAGTSTCAGYAGSLGFEDVDAATFSKWGVDYLKYDNCNIPSNWTDPTSVPPGFDWSTSNSAKRYHMMRDALLKQNHTIQFSICIWGQAHVEQWANSTGHSYRATGDISANWAGGVMPLLNQASFKWNWTGFWAHADWDMLEVGRAPLTLQESRSHFALWAALKSPLIIGAPLVNMSTDILAILKNEELLAYNQDSVHGEGIMPYKWGLNPDGTSNSSFPAQYWTGSSVRGLHVFMLNTLNTTSSLTATVSEIPALRSLPAGTNFIIHDMWTGKDLGTFNTSYKVSLPAHDTAALRFTLTNGSHPNPTWKPF